jgi:hypothetical protein
MQMFFQQAFAFRLRQQQRKVVGAVNLAQLDVRNASAAGEHVGAVPAHAGRDESLRAARAIQQFQRAAPHRERFGFVGARMVLFDDADSHAVTRQFHGESEADRPSADDEDLRIHARSLRSIVA